MAICSGVTSSRSWPNANRPGSTSESRFGSNGSPFEYSPLGARSFDGVSSGGVE